jgi:hypothetical protein
MADDEVYTRRIRKLQKRGLLNLLSAIKAGQAPNWPPGRAFEYLVLRAFDLEKADITWPYTVDLRGEVAEQIDGAVHLGGLSFLMECKDQANPVNVEPITKLRNQLFRRTPSTMGVVFARGTFTEPARVLAQYMLPIQVLLWEGRELEFALKRQKMTNGLLAKHRWAVEQGFPDYVLNEGKVL